MREAFLEQQIIRFNLLERESLSAWNDSIKVVAQISVQTGSFYLLLNTQRDTYYFVRASSLSSEAESYLCAYVKEYPIIVSEEAMPESTTLLVRELR